MRTRTVVALAFFRFLEDRHIRYCVVGDVRGFPAVVKSDVDIVVDEANIAAIPAEIGAFCDRYDVRLIQCLEHEQNARYFVVSWTDANDGVEYLAIDICGDYYRNGRRLLLATELLATHQRATDNKNRDLGFWVPAPAIGFIYYLLKRIDKAALDEQQSDYLFEQWQRNPQTAAKYIERLWGITPEARLLIRASEANDWSVVRCILPRLRRVMRKRRPFSLQSWSREWSRRCRRFLHPTGLMIAVLGPDGSGKSSALQATADYIEPIFRNCRQVHLRPRVIFGRGSQQQAVTTPHALTPRGPLASLAKLLMLIADYRFGYWSRIRFLLARSTVVMFDRYYDDLQVDPRRYRYGASLNSLRLLSWLVPKPDLYFVLDAPAEVLQARKQEVDFEESVRQRNAYLALAAQRSNFTVVDTTQSLEKTAASIGATIAACVARRTAQHMEKLMVAKRNPKTSRWLLFCCRHRLPVISKLMRVIFNSDIYCPMPRDVLLPHPYGIVIHSKTVIGRRVTIMQQVTLGGKNIGEDLAPVICDGVYIGAGAKILGPVRVGAGAVIGANAIVTQDVPAHVTVVGANRIVGRTAAITGIEDYLKEEKAAVGYSATPATAESLR